MEARGFRVTEQPFEYSALPGLYGTPVTGMLLVFTSAGVYHSLSHSGATGSVNGTLEWGVCALVLLAGGGAWVGRHGTTTLPILRRRAVNLEAVPVGTPADGGTPPVWLVAHLDSKSQPIPMLLRVAGVICCAAAWICMLALWAISALFPVPGQLFAAVALLSTLGALPLALCFVGHRGTGALDNASGVAAVLAALDRLGDVPVGVLLTSGEELGLAGARAWVRGRPPAAAVNCDSVDDHGGLVCILPRRGGSTLRAACRSAAGRAGVTPTFRTAIPGVLVDAVAFTGAGWQALTVSRGRWRTLARIHTHDDDLAHMTGAGIGEAAGFLASLVGVIVASSRDEGAASDGD